ncbi:MAG: isochorismatase family protein [Streptosporangiaceae bacterium]|jgi:nicotinamidase-related amidase
MIDCQNTYRQGIMQLEGVEAALAEAARFLARVRAAGIPVFHIMHDAEGWWSVPCRSPSSVGAWN